MKALGNLHSSATAEAWPRAYPEPLEERYDHRDQHNGVRAAKDHPLDTMGEVLSLFTDPASFRDRLEYVSQNLSTVTHAWAEPCQPDPDATLGVLHALVTKALVPAGCEEAQEILMQAMQCFREASEGIHRAKLAAKPSERQAAWDVVWEGQTLLGQAIKLVNEVSEE